MTKNKKVDKKKNILKNVFMGIVVLAFLEFGFNCPEKMAEFPELLKPTGITIGDKYLYIHEETTIHIYSLNDYRLVWKFGKKGEGPGEFKDSPTVKFYKDLLLIYSIGKLSFFSKDGKFIRDVRSPRGQSHFSPLEAGYIGRTRILEDNISYFTINLFNSQLIRGKEIYRVEDFEQRKRATITFPVREPKYATIENKIILAGKPGFVIDIFDHTGKRIQTIQDKNFRRRKFTKEDEQWELHVSNLLK